MSLNRFVELSLHLTDENTLDDQLAENYYQILSKEFPDFDILLEEIVSQNGINNLVINHHDEMKKTILLLWYQGSFNNKIVSVEAYQKSLLWRHINATPIGVSQGFGSWQINPEEQ